MNEKASSRHILFITGEYPPMTGGVGAYTERLADALLTLGWQTSVLTTAQVQDTQKSPAIHLYPLVKRWDWRIWRMAPDLAARIGAGWVHVQYQTAAFGMNPSVNFAPGRWRRQGCLVAWTYHDLLVPYLFPKAGDQIRKTVTRRPARIADLTIVTNEDDRRALEETAPNLHRIPIGSNIQASQVSQAERSEIRRGLGYDDDDYVIAYFGFLNRSKGGLTLIRTLDQVRQRLPQARLLMIGERVGASDPTNYRFLREVESLVDELGLRADVQWTGRLEDKEVSNALAAVDVLFMPYEDGASLRRGTLMAGLVNGCAIVTTTPRVPIPELIDEQDVLYVPVADVTASAGALLRVAADDALSARLKAGARTAGGHFTWHEIARKHAGLYESIARRSA